MEPQALSWGWVTLFVDADIMAIDDARDVRTSFQLWLCLVPLDGCVAGA